MIPLDILRHAYGLGLFPMADSEHQDAEIEWYQPTRRALFIPEVFHVPRRLARLIRQCDYRVEWNKSFEQVMLACNANREASWINPVLIESYTQWHHSGEAFCLAVCDGNEAVGGVYGVLQGSTFMAESMFSTRSNASSIALVVLMAGLVKAGVKMIDVQFVNPHLEKFNPQEWSHKKYLRALQNGMQENIELKADYFTLDVATSFVQSLTHTS